MMVSSKQPCNELILCSDVSFVRSRRLSLPDHVHRLIPAYCSPGCRVREEPQARLDPSLDEAVILLNNVVHILAGPALAFLRKQLFALEVTDSANVGGILINVDHPWGDDVRSVQDFSEETLGRSRATGLVQEEIEGLAN